MLSGAWKLVTPRFQRHALDAIEARLMYPPPYPLSERACAVQCRVHGHHQEFLAAPAAVPITVAELPVDRLDDADQHPIFPQVTMTVVDGLEVVHAVNDQGWGIAVAGRALAFLVEQLHEAAPVQRAREGVVAGLETRLCFQAQALR